MELRIENDTSETVKVQYSVTFISSIKLIHSASSMKPNYSVLISLQKSFPDIILNSVKFIMFRDISANIILLLKTISDVNLIFM